MREEKLEIILYLSYLGEFLTDDEQITMMGDL